MKILVCLHCVAVCCSVLQCVAVCIRQGPRKHQCIAVCCNVLQCVVLVAVSPRVPWQTKEFYVRTNHVCKNVYIHTMMWLYICMVCMYVCMMLICIHTWCVFLCMTCMYSLMCIYMYDVNIYVYGAYMYTYIEQWCIYVYIYTMMFSTGEVSEISVTFENVWVLNLCHLWCIFLYL